MVASDPAKSPAWQGLLLRFLSAGLALFLLQHWLLPADVADRRIVLTRATKAHFARELENELGRAPTQGDLAQRAARWKLDEVAYREGRSAGLDRTEPGVRHEVARAFRALSAQLATAREPTPSELERFLAEHRRDYARPDGSLLPDDQLRPALRADFRAAELAAADERRLRELARDYEFVEVTE